MKITAKLSLSGLHQRRGWVVPPSGRSKLFQDVLFSARLGRKLPDCFGMEVERRGHFPALDATEATDTKSMIKI
jgi:hypothetical protein